MSKRKQINTPWDFAGGRLQYLFPYPAEVYNLHNNLSGVLSDRQFDLVRGFKMVIARDDWWKYFRI